MFTDLVTHIATVRVLVLLAMAILWIAVATPRTEPGIVTQFELTAPYSGE